MTQSLSAPGPTLSELVPELQHGRVLMLNARQWCGRYEGPCSRKLVRHSQRDPSPRPLATWSTSVTVRILLPQMIAKRLVGVSPFEPCTRDGPGCTPAPMTSMRARLRPKHSVSDWTAAMHPRSSALSSSNSHHAPPEEIEHNA